MVLRLIAASSNFVMCSLMNLLPWLLPPYSERCGGYLYTFHMRELVILVVSTVEVVLLCFWLCSPS